MSRALEGRRLLASLGATIRILFGILLGRAIREERAAEIRGETKQYDSALAAIGYQACKCHDRQDLGIDFILKLLIDAMDDIACRIGCAITENGSRNFSKLEEL